MSGVYGPPRKRNPVGAPPPQRWWERHARHRYAVRIPLADVLDDWLAICLHYLATAPYRGPRWLYRRRDHDLAPIVAGVLLFVVFVGLSGVSPVHLLPRSLELIACSVAGAAVAWAFVEDDGQAATERSVREMQKEITARINGLTVAAVIRRPWAITAVCSVARGLDPQDYELQKSTLASSFRAPVAITRDTPGRLELRIELEDLLARQAEWRPMGDPDPFHVPLGHDWDGGPVDWPMPGHAMLIAGERGGGKSSLMNAQIAHAASIPNVEIRIIDPLAGVDLSSWWPVAETVGDTPELGWKVLHEAHQLWEERLFEMRQAGVEKATWPEWSLRLLVIDELSSLTHSARLPRQQRIDNLSHLEDLLTKGRKTLDVVIASTQFPTADVIPTLIRGQFTRRVGLRVEEASQTNVILGDGTLGRGINLTTIPEAHRGRGYLKAGSNIIGVRTAGLWGAQAKTVARRLAEQAASPLPDDCHLATDPPPSVGENGRGGPSYENLPVPTAEKIRRTLPDSGDGVSVPWLIEQTGLSERTIRYHLGRQPWVVKVRHGRYRRQP